MFKEIKISGFRGLDDVRLSGLAKINIITGDNSSGKTAIMEAIYLATADSGPLRTMPSLFRHIGNNSEWDNYWLWLFKGKTNPGRFELTFKVADDTYLVSVGSTTEGLAASVTQSTAGRSRVITRQSFSSGGSGGNFPMLPHASIAFFRYETIRPEIDAERFSALSATQNGEDQILHLVQQIDSRIIKMRYLKLPNNPSPLVYLDIGLKQLLPSSQMGQGFCVLFSLFLEILTTQANVLLIDEIENGLHRDVMGKVWDGLAKLLSIRNIQLFATTHSRECINAAHQAAVANEEVGFSHHTLKFDGGKVICLSAEGAL